MYAAVLLTQSWWVSLFVPMIKFIIGEPISFHLGLSVKSYLFELGEKKRFLTAYLELK